MTLRLLFFAWLLSLHQTLSALQTIVKARCVQTIYTTTMTVNKPRRLICNAMLLVCMLTVQACASPPTRPNDVCSIFAEKRGWHKAAVSAQEKWGTSMHVPMAFMFQESTFRAKARPPRKKLLGFIPWRRLSSAYGYAQAIDGTWSQYLRATGEYWRVRTDFADATDFIHWYMREAIRINKVSANDAYNLYLNYHEGTTGFARKSHQAKPWLLRAAENVQRRSQRYHSQYEECRTSLKPGFFRRLLGW